MALPRWVKWSLAGLAGLMLFAAVLVGAGLWFLSSRIIPNVAVGELLPAVQLASLDGASVEIEGYRGQVVVLDFWSSW